MLFRRALLNGTPPTSRPRSRRNSKAHSIGEGGSPLPTTVNAAGQLESHEMHNIAYSPAGTTSKEEYGSDGAPEYHHPPPQAPRMTAYASSPTTSASSGAPFATLAPRPLVPTYTPSPSMPYQARAPAWSPAAPSSAGGGRGSVSSSTGLLGAGQQRSGSRQGLVPAAEPMAEAVPSFYAARSQYS
ncbi:hypothetical protein BCR35DRAFT_303905 [Leucosporidium creatinivorum]|uniref:Uncharacterized protein n=1 Tax=Leucosporidium creatinivorum TaxID=106004 RepID=A0A1Y2FCW7_9BASI|nr:hypothetical protein BCR35DRAFT_303905 [Leucosporidium creatinivorum]